MNFNFWSNSQRKNTNSLETKEKPFGHLCTRHKTFNRLTFLRSFHKPTKSVLVSCSPYVEFPSTLTLCVCLCRRLSIPVIFKKFPLLCVILIESFIFYWFIYSFNFIFQFFFSFKTNKTRFLCVVMDDAC